MERLSRNFAPFSRLRNFQLGDICSFEQLFYGEKVVGCPWHFPCPDSTNLLQVDKGILQLWIKSVLGFLSIASFLRGGGERFFGFRQFLSQLFPARKYQR